MRAESSAIALQMALENRGTIDYDQQLIHHSDRGSQYVSKLYTDLLEQYNIRISMCTNVYENAIQERVNRTIKSQYLKNWRIKNKYELDRKLEQAVYAYNFDKPHSSLSKKCPVEFEILLPSIPVKHRPLIKIFTRDNRQTYDPNQIRIMF
jgi:transposase InsO family protein